MCAYVNLDFKRVNVECARGTLNHYHYDTSSRKHGIRTVSRSCAYACGFSNDRVDENFSRKHHIRTVSRSCEYACAFVKRENNENASRTHHIRTVSRSCEYACDLANDQID